MSSIEIHAPWLLRYVAVIGLLANRPLLVRTMEVMDRVEKLEDPILDFLKNMAEKLDWLGRAGLRGGVEAAGVLSRRIRERFLPEQDGREDSDGGSVERGGR